MADLASSRQLAIAILCTVSLWINTGLMTPCPCNHLNNGAKARNLLEETFRVRNNTLEETSCTMKGVIFLGGFFMNSIILFAITALAMTLTLPTDQKDNVHKDTAPVATSSLLAAKNGSVTTLNTLLDVE